MPDYCRSLQYLNFVGSMTGPPLLQELSTLTVSTCTHCKYRSDVGEFHPRAWLHWQGGTSHFFIANWPVSRNLDMNFQDSFFFFCFSGGCERSRVSFASLLMLSILQAFPHPCIRNQRFCRLWNPRSNKYSKSLFQIITTARYLNADNNAHWHPKYPKVSRIFNWLSRGPKLGVRCDITAKLRSEPEGHPHVIWGCRWFFLWLSEATSWSSKPSLEVSGSHKTNTSRFGETWWIPDSAWEASK